MLRIPLSPGIWLLLVDPKVMISMILVNVTCSDDLQRKQEFDWNSKICKHEYPSRHWYLFSLSLHQLTLSPNNYTRNRAYIEKWRKMNELFLVLFHSASLFCFLLCRTKSQGWFRITWICSYVFFKGEVNIFLLSSNSFIVKCGVITCHLCSLPWQGLKAGTKKQKYEKISEKKVNTSIEVNPCLGVASDTCVKYDGETQLDNTDDILFCLRPYVVDTLLNLLHTSIIVGR